MKVACLQENLDRGLKIVGRAAPGKSTLPIIDNVLVATDHGRLKLAATNLELGITAWIGCQVEEEGATTIPARLLNDFVGSLPNERIYLQLDPRTQTTRVQCARFDANIKGLDAEDFPIIPTITDEPLVTIRADLFHEMIGQVVFAAASDDSRPVLAGVLMSFEGNTLTLAAADGYRLAVRSADLAAAVPDDFSIIVPARALTELARITADAKDEEEVQITVTPSRNQILFHLDEVDLVSRLIEGNFPNYKQIVPPADRWETRMVVSAQEFLKSARLASFIARQNADIVKLSMTAGAETEPGALSLQAVASEVGENVSELDAQVQGKSMQIAFNCRFLMDVLAVVPTAQVALETAGSNSAGVLRPVGANDFVHVIMPMHLASR